MCDHVEAYKQTLGSYERRRRGGASAYENDLSKSEPDISLVYSAEMWHNSSITLSICGSGFITSFSLTPVRYIRMLWYG